MVRILTLKRKIRHFFEGLNPVEECAVCLEKFSARKGFLAQCGH